MKKGRLAEVREKARSLSVTHGEIRENEQKRKEGRVVWGGMRFKTKKSEEDILKLLAKNDSLREKYVRQVFFFVLFYFYFIFVLIFSFFFRKDKEISKLALIINFLNPKKLKEKKSLSLHPSLLSSSNPFFFFFLDPL